MAVRLNVANSIVDYLRSQGQPYDFSSRKSLYEKQGLQNTFGGFQGSAAQNTALLQQLQRQAQPAQSTPQVASAQAVPAGAVNSVGSVAADEARLQELARGGQTAAPVVAPSTSPYTAPGQPETLTGQIVDQTPFDPLQAAISRRREALSRAGEQYAPELGQITEDYTGQFARGAQKVGEEVGGIRAAGAAQTEAERRRGIAERLARESQLAQRGLVSSGIAQSELGQVQATAAGRQAQVEAKTASDILKTLQDAESKYGTEFLRSLGIPEASSFLESLPAPVRGVLERQFAKEREGVQTKILSEANRLEEQISKIEDRNFDQAYKLAQLELQQQKTPASYQEWELAGRPGTFAGWLDRTASGQAPSSYKEWTLAGSPGTYQDWLEQARSSSSSVPSSFKEWQLSGSPGTYGEWLDRKSKVGDLDTRTASQVDALSRSFDSNPIVKNYIEVQNKKATVDGILSRGSTGPGDLALVYEFMKALDPTSVVRESEYASAAQSGNIFAGIFARFNGYLRPEGGLLPQAVREEFRNLVDTKYGVISSQYDNLYNETARKINLKTGGTDGSEFITDYRGGIETLEDLMRQSGYDPNELQQLRQLYDDDTIRGMLKKKMSNTSSSSGTGGEGNLGALSAQYESSGNPGAIGYDRTGGYSYGVYQLAQGKSKAFLDQSPYANQFRGLTPDSAAYRERWQQVAQQDPDGFRAAQEAYIKKTHYDPQMQKLRSLGYDADAFSPVVKQVIWSTSVQHGPATNVVANALKRVGKGASDEDIIRAIYDARWSGGNQFASSTAAVKNSVYNRFFGANGEMNRALRSIG